jgi:hypothetical protein
LAFLPPIGISISFWPPALRGFLDASRPYHLRLQQQVISSAVFAALGTSLTESKYLQGWLGLGATQRVIQSAQVKPAGCDLEHVTIRQAA